MKYEQAQSNRLSLPAGVEQVIKILLFSFVVVMGFFAFTLLTNVESVYVSDAGKLSDFDFTSDIAYISEQCFDWYPEAFYTPGDFASGSIAEQPVTDDDGSAGYYTYRLALKLEEGKVYGLSGNSATYAQTLWIDGTMYSSVGTPGSSREEMTPQMSYFTVYFEAKGETEIVIHRSGFVHANGGRFFPLYLGEQAAITSMTSRIWVRGAIIIGCMLMAALVFFGIFLFSRERRHFLWFSLACLAITVRSLSTEHKLIMTLLPELNWYLALKVEYLATMSFHFFLFMYVNKMTGQEIKQPANIAGLVFVSLYSFLILLTPSTVYTAFLPYMQLCALLYVFATIILLTRLMIKNRNKRLPESFLILIGTVGYTVLLIMEVARYYFDFLYRDLNLSQTGMTVFVFANTLALALNFTRTETELNEARQSEREKEETNRMLARLERVRSEFLSNISHEIRTPLTVMSGYAQRALRQIDAGTVNEDTRQGLLTVSLEAQRLAMLSQQILDTSTEIVGAGLGEPADPARILERTTALCRPILGKNGNRLQTHIEPGCPTVRADEGMVLQMLINLCVNANRHTRDGVVSVTAARAGDMALFTVTDDGDGIDPALLPRVFERGISGDGESGLGLSLCKDVVEAHGGQIGIESSPGAGTRVMFTLPPADKSGEGEA